MGTIKKNLFANNGYIYIRRIKDQYYLYNDQMLCRVSEEDYVVLNEEYHIFPPLQNDQGLAVVNINNELSIAPCGDDSEVDRAFEIICSSKHDIKNNLINTMLTFDCSPDPDYKIRIFTNILGETFLAEAKWIDIFEQLFNGKVEWVAGNAKLKGSDERPIFAYKEATNEPFIVLFPLPRKEANMIRQTACQTTSIMFGPEGERNRKKYTNIQKSTASKPSFLKTHLAALILCIIMAAYAYISSFIDLNRINTPALQISSEQTYL